MRKHRNRTKTGHTHAKKHTSQQPTTTKMNKNILWLRQNADFSVEESVGGDLISFGIQFELNTSSRPHVTRAHPKPEKKTTKNFSHKEHSTELFECSPHSSS